MALLAFPLLRYLLKFDGHDLPPASLDTRDGIPVRRFSEKWTHDENRGPVVNPQRSLIQDGGQKSQ